MQMPMSKISFRDWQAQQNQDPEFLPDCRRLEPGYQVARPRLLRGMSQAELADRVRTRQASITCLENGSSMPSLSFLKRVAEALDAQVEIKVTPKARRVE